MTGAARSMADGATPRRDATDVVCGVGKIKPAMRPAEWPPLNLSRGHVYLHIGQSEGKKNPPFGHTVEVAERGVRFQPSESTVTR